MAKILLIDADIACFQFACTNQQIIHWDEEVSSEVLTPEVAKADLDAFVQRLLQQTKCSRALFCFTSHPAWRFKVLPTYKHNRRNKERPKLLDELKDHIRQNYEVREKPTLEADDVMGVLATRNPGRYLLASLDKDLLQIPGEHYNWRKEERVTITEEEANHRFYLQALTGDPTDGFSGCPGIGPKRAELILAGAKDPWAAIVRTYESKGLTEEDALAQARVARILRATDYDFDNRKVILWTPPGRAS